MDGIFQQDRNGTCHTHVFHGERLAVKFKAKNDVFYPALQVIHVFGETEDGHDFRSRSNIEASFLGLGVKFPFASWGNIMNDVSNSYVLTSYWFIWIPAGICLMLTVLGFNFVGDGLRDAFDPKMKR